MSSEQPYTASSRGKNPVKYGVVRLIHSQVATQHGGSAEFTRDNCARVTGCAERFHANAAALPLEDQLSVRQNERPVRGDNRTGQAIWALGWMGARAGYSLVGEG